MSDQQLDDEHVLVTEFTPPTNCPWDILHPVTIFQILQAGDSLITEGKKNTSVILVAHVTRVHISARASFILEDGTGRISADLELASLSIQHGLSAEAEENEKSKYQDFEHTYVQVTATLSKNNPGWKPRIKINGIHPVHGYHQVMYHLLDVIHSHMLSQKQNQVQPDHSDQDSGPSEDVEDMLVDDGQANQNISTQYYITHAVPASPPILPNTFSPQRYQPYATLEPLERAIMKHVHRNQPILIAEVAQAIEESFGCTELQFKLAVESLLLEAYITSPLDDKYMVVTPRH